MANPVDQLNDRLKQKPPEMNNFKTLSLDMEQPTVAGLYYSIEVQQATAELRHEAMVVDQDDRPLAGVAVLFGYDTGDKHPLPSLDYWGKFGELRGNLQYTNGAGEAFHTFKDGGEDIFVVDYQVENGIQCIARASDVWWNCPSVNVGGGGRFEHTGVRIKFRRYTPGVGTHADVHADIEARLKALETGK